MLGGTCMVSVSYLTLRCGTHRHPVMALSPLLSGSPGPLRIIKELD